jgi:hypothetical protein
MLVTAPLRLYHPILVHQVYEDMPQEMRSRFWYVLLERPDLVQALSVS